MSSSRKTDGTKWSVFIYETSFASVRDDYNKRRGCVIRDEHNQPWMLDRFIRDEDRLRLLLISKRVLRCFITGWTLRLFITMTNDFISNELNNSVSISWWACAEWSGTKWNGTERIVWLIVYQHYWCAQAYWELFSTTINKKIVITIYYPAPQLRCSTQPNKSLPCRLFRWEWK